MYHLSGEVLDPWERRMVGIVIVVVAGRKEQESALVGLVVAVLPGMNRPGVGVGVPVGGPYVGVESNVLVDVMLVRRVAQILPNLVTVGDHLGPRPRLPRKAQRVDIAVG